MNAVNDTNLDSHEKSNLALVGVVWLVVLLPLAWGVYNTVKTSAKLFESAPAAAASAPAIAPGSTSAP